VDELELALVVVAEGEDVVLAALGQEAALELGATGVPAVARVGVAAALPVGLEVGRVLGRNVLAGGVVAERLLLDAVRDVRQPAEVVVERPVLHHHQDEVVDLDVARAGDEGLAGLRVGGLAQDQVGGQHAGRPGQPGGVRRALQEVPAPECFLVHGPRASSHAESGRAPVLVA
jgi:hypothetical protein